MKPSKEYIVMCKKCTMLQDWIKTQRENGHWEMGDWYVVNDAINCSNGSYDMFTMITKEDVWIPTFGQAHSLTRHLNGSNIVVHTELLQLLNFMKEHDSLF